MSCERNPNKFGSVAAARAGLSHLSSKAGYVAGNIAGRAVWASDTATNLFGKTVAPASNRVLKVLDRPTTIGSNLLPVLATAAVYAQVKVATTGPAQGQRPGAAVAVGMREISDIRERKKALGQVKKGLAAAALIGGLAALAMANLTEEPESKRKLAQRKKRLLVGERKVEVTLAKSKLTGWLNKRNSLLSTRNVLSSQGDLVHYDQSVWHRGTTVVRLPAGKRTITHIHKLGLPSTSYFFERPLSDGEVASLVSGQRQAHQMAGYVGTIGAMESLAPSWALVKRSLILTRLHWPTDEKPAARWVKTGPTEQVVIKPPPQTSKVKQREKITNQQVR